METPLYKNQPPEPVDHAIGRSRGGLTTKLHTLVDGRGRPLVLLVGPGHGHDSPMLPVLPGALRVPRTGAGRARTRPDQLCADKAYSAKAHRTLLRRRGVRVVIPERTDQQAHRRRRGSAGGRPPRFDAAAYRGRNVVERSYNVLKQWRAWPPGMTNSPSSSAAAPSYAASSSGSQLRRQALAA